MSNIDQNYTDSLEEKIFTCDKIENIRKTLTDFFSEVVRRRKYDEKEDGLQASLIASDYKIGAKINDRDGAAPHVHSIINIIRYLDGKKTYLKESSVTNYSLCKEETHKLIHEYIEYRIITNPDYLLIAIYEHSGEKKLLSDMQIETIKQTINICMQILDKKIFPTIKVGLSVPGIYEEVQTFDKSIYNKLLQDLDEYQKKEKLSRH